MVLLSAVNLCFIYPGALSLSSLLVLLLLLPQRAEDVSRLQENIKPYLLRRMKEDVEKAVPPKEETIIEVIYDGTAVLL